MSHAVHVRPTTFGGLCLGPMSKTDSISVLWKGEGLKKPVCYSSSLIPFDLGAKDLSCVATCIYAIEIESHILSVRIRIHVAEQQLFHAGP